MDDVTVLYYTANGENETFEEKIKSNILKNIGDLPLVSVSQIPIDFGRNICVGRHTSCYPNEYRQIQIGLETIHTRYVLSAESDFLYPPEYFNFILDGDGLCYRYTPVWVLFFKNRKNYYYKGYSEGAQLRERNDWLNDINDALIGLPEWSDVKNLPRFPVPKTRLEYTWSGNPAITFKTGLGVSQRTRIDKSNVVRELPHWGSAVELAARMK